MLDDDMHARFSSLAENYKINHIGEERVPFESGRLRIATNFIFREHNLNGPIN